MPRIYLFDEKKKKTIDTHTEVWLTHQEWRGGKSGFTLNIYGERATGIPAPKTIVSDQKMQMKISQAISIS